MAKDYQIEKKQLIEADGKKGVSYYQIARHLAYIKQRLSGAQQDLLQPQPAHQTGQFHFTMAMVGEVGVALV